MSAADRDLMIVTALPEEARAIARALGRRSAPAHRATTRHVAWTGDGPVRARRGLAELLDRHHPSAVIGAGVAGGLAGSLRPGAVVRAERIIDAAGQGEILPRVPLLAEFPEATFVSAPRPIARWEEKLGLAARLGLRGPAVVDLESYPWARACREAGVPFAAVRVVLDPAGESLPSYIGESVRNDGSSARNRLALGALAHPSRVLELWRLRQQLHASCRILARALRSSLQG